MLRDITIGQYFPGHSFIHKMDPRMKLIAAVLYIIVLFVASRPLGMALGIALVVLMYMISGISAKLVVKSLKPVVPIIIFTAILNLFFLVGDGEPIFSLWFLHIYREGVAMAIMMAVRIMCWGRRADFFSVVFAHLPRRCGNGNHDGSAHHVSDCWHLPADLHHLAD